MVRSRTQPTKAKKPYISILIIGWAVLCILLSLSLIRSAYGVKTAFTAREKAREMLNAEQKKNTELKEKLEKAKDPLTQERIIRDELNKQKPGESVLLLPSPTP